MHGVAGATLSGMLASGLILRQGMGRMLKHRGQSTLRLLPAEHPEQWPADLRAKLPRAASSAAK